MKIAILGGGLAGVATAWYLLNSSPLLNFAGSLQLDLYDPLGIAGGASGIAAGILHPYAGLHAKLNRQGKEGYLATCELIEIASKFTSANLITARGQYRLVSTAENDRDYRLAASHYADVDFLTAQAIERQIPSMTSHPGIFIHSSLTIATSLYLESLWQGCVQKGATLQREAITHLSSLDHDLIIIATSFASNQFLETSAISINPVKGQLLEIEWPKNLIAPLATIHGQAYLVMQASKQSAFIGATFEKDFNSPHADLPLTKAQLMPKIAALWPALQEADVITCKAGIRASMPTHQPLIRQVTNQCWVFTGLGSKGLLYHALYAKKLVTAILDQFKLIA